MSQDRDEELEHLRHGIAIFTAAYEAACNRKGHAARRSAIDAWLEEHRRREWTKVEQEDRRRAEQTEMPTCAGRYGDT